ncbi:proteasome subunit beta type-1-like [Nilaparvata lugens]|uniref:proteasome subunit beta type-1 n=1 Tax=Nilaparvata lugens TaxID=108931 RepID=UPI000B99AE04|nr:proteasome subunit beta type-1 [Nilaparvata lugens]XP_039300041.1 proteasome subunit beta type-1-like [Nilaparvata lugens]
MEVLSNNYYGARPTQLHFSPYEDNGGTVVAIAGEDFAIIGSDTRLSTGYSIETRNQTKLFRLSSKTVLGCTGCWCDALSLAHLMQARMQMYLHEHNKEMSSLAVGQMLSTVLYNRRFFPYYVSNIVAGLDADGKGILHSYDPVGHCEKTHYVAGGSAGAFLQPLLDNQIGLKNMQNMELGPVSMERALNLVKDSFIAAAERDFYTGDGVHINIITKDGIKEDRMVLRKD